MKSLLFLWLMFPSIEAQTIQQLLQMCNGLSCPEPFDSHLGIGQYYQLAVYSNQTLIGNNFTCPHELWEIARNGTIFVNRERTTLEEGDLQMLSSLIIEPIPSEPRFSSNYLWKREGPDSPVFGRLSYCFKHWDDRRYLFAHACRMSGLYTFYLLSREPNAVPLKHKKRLQELFNFQYSHEFSFDSCASVRPSVCFRNPPKKLAGLQIFYEPF